MTKIKKIFLDKFFSKAKIASKKISRKQLFIFLGAAVFVGASFFAVSFVLNNKRTLAISSLSAIGKISKFLPIGKDEKKELDVLNTIVDKITQNDGVERSFMIMLQNDTELRPGGGFLGQYAILKIKNAQVTSVLVEDANLLDQRINVKVAPPFPFKKMLSLSRWKFRDSNFSPDFPTNVEKAKYFYRLSGRSSQGLEGVIAVNSKVFDDLFTLTGPIVVPGYTGEYNATNASRKLEEQVEKAYLMDPALDTQNRKAILKTMAPIIVDKLLTLGNIPKIAELMHSELKNRNVMLNFSDQTLQSAVESVFWDGAVPKTWGGDYLMAVDANMGALKTDYYIKREMHYDVDLTQEKPLVTLDLTYKNTAPYGDWRTSDYHSYLRLYVPKGATFLDSHMVSHLNNGDEFGKTYFGFKCDVLINNQTNATVRYYLPDYFSNMSINDYKLLVQKQSGAGDVPVAVHVKAKDGEYTVPVQTLKNDLNFAYSQQ